ncbi:hypothetical protein pipiens_007629 [Culex pipiens pipiens]|uniref:Peptidase A2 domain-containing protein n=2 Tax=Culex pipiens pipiens TaxID=38569 RepID=A0ABD1DKE8_CULPP
MHAHILFKDSAYTWYTTYHDRFDCWNTLEHYLRLRYDNPNQDSIIKFELHNRKQRPNEKFSAFLTDLEFLAQRLTYRVPEKEIFELAKANMKLSYQRRLVLVTIESLDHLSNLCSRMDALEASLNKSTVHQIDLEEGCLEDEHDPELVYALQGRQGKCVRSKKENQPGSAEQRMESIETTVHRCPHIKVRVLSEEVEGLADTGASLSIISAVDLINKLGLLIHPANLRISTADGTSYSCLGYVNLPISFKDTTHVLKTIVVPEVKKDLILGIDFLNKFGFQLLAPNTGDPVTEGCVNSLDFALVEDYFGDEEEKICFQLQPTSEQIEVSEEKIEIDESLEIPTVEIPENILIQPSDIETEHQLTDEERTKLFEAVLQLPATKDGSKLSDPYVVQLKERIEQEPERYSDFTVRDGKVYKYVTNATEMEDPAFRWKYVVPMIERKPVIKEIHEEAHLGFVKVLAKKFKPSFKPTRVSAQLKLVAPRRQIEWLNVNKLIFDQALDLARRLVRLVLSVFPTVQLFSASRCVCGHGRSAIYRWLLPNERTVARDPGWCTWTTNWRAADAYRARHVEQRVSGHVGKRTKPASLRRRRASRSARVDARDHPAEPEQASRPVLVVAFLEVPRTHRK